MSLRYLSVCSGIEAATVAWHPLGWQPIAFAEVESFPRAVLAHHYPSVLNWGDITKFREWPDATVDVLVGGTPCQSFSVAGLRAGLGDPRGNLALTFLAIADRYRPRWVVWENVPGVLSSTSHDAPDPCPPAIDLDGDDGPRDGEEVMVEDEYDADEVHAFACLLAGFSELGYYGAYGTLDAQYFRLAQRRRRVFVVFHFGDWRRAAPVLLERASLSGHPAPRRETGEGAAAGTLRSTDDGGSDVDNARAEHLVVSGHCVHGVHWSEDCRACGIWRQYPRPQHVPEIVPQAMSAKWSKGSSGPAGDEVANLVAFDTYNQAVNGDLSQTLCSRGDTPGGNAHLVPAIAFDTTQITHPENRSNPQPGDPSPSLAKGAQAPAIAFQESQSGFRSGESHPTLDSHNGSRRHHGVITGFADIADPVAANQARTYTREGSHNFRMSNVAHTGMQVRRLTPRECERLQGFPDDYTLIPFRGKPAADGPRYKALGNSMAVPVMAWIGRRIALVEAID